MRKIRLFVTIFTCASILLLFITFRSQTTAADVKVVNLSIRPEKVLFKVENMAPGDWSIRDLAIINDGESDLRYSLSIKKISGSKLFNELDLQILADNTKLYEGKLTKFKELSPRQLLQANEEVLTFQVDFPPELGNDFQGAKTEFNIIINAEEITGGGGGGEVSPGKDPDPNNPEPSKPDPNNPETGNPDGEGTTEQPNPEEPGEGESGNTPDDDPETAPGSGDNGTNNPADPSGTETGPDSQETIGEGKLLPNTATNMFNYMLAGGLLILAGLASIIIAKRRKSVDKTL